MWLLILLAHAETWTVVPEGGGDANSIYEALLLVEYGDTLLLAPGIYREGDFKFISPLALTIQGAGTGETIIDGSDTEKYAFYVSKADVTFQGITFQNHETLATIMVGSEELNSVHIQDCAFVNNSVGVALWTTSGLVRVDSSIFIGNDLATMGAYGIDQLAVENSVFVDNDSVFVMDEYAEQTFEDVSFVNNTIIGGTIAFEFSNVEGDGHRNELTLLNNIILSSEYALWTNWISIQGEFRSNILSPGAEIRNDSEDLLEIDNLEADVDFTAWSDDGDWTNDDLRLLAGSAGIDYGVTGYASATTDLDGKPRALDGDGDGSVLPDAGAYELGEDGDGDGGYATTIGGDDCDDGDAAVYAGAEEICGDGADQDCDGADPACPDTGADSGDSAEEPPDSPAGQETGSGSEGGAETGAPSKVPAPCGCAAPPGSRTLTLALPALLLALRRRQRRSAGLY